MEENEELQLNPILDEFFDARTYGEKYEILVKYQQDITDDKMIDDMATSIDEVIKDGELYDRIVELKGVLRTKSKYENTRLRGRR